MASWGQWLSSATYSAGTAVTEYASVAASKLEESETFNSLRDSAVNVATTTFEGVAGAVAVVEETTESAIASASVMAERRLLATNISLLESDIETAKREWGLTSWAAMAEGDLDTVKAEFEKAKALVEEIEASIESKRRHIQELDRPTAVHTPAATFIPVPAPPEAQEMEPRPAPGLQMPLDDAAEEGEWSEQGPANSQLTLPQKQNKTRQ